MQEDSDFSDNEKTNAGEDQLLVGGGDELGGYDDSQFADTDESKNKKKSNNIIRKHLQTLS